MISPKSFLILLGDIAVLYASLLLTLVIRYGSGFYVQLVRAHFFPFTVIFSIWIVVFYIAGLYDMRQLRNNMFFLKVLALSLVVNFTLAAFAFYFLPIFGIAPKTNLFIFIAIFSVLEVYWRRYFNARTAGSETPNKVILVGNEKDLRPIEEIEAGASDWMKQLGYKIVARMGEEEAISRPEKINKLKNESGGNVIVIPRHLKSSAPLTRELYKLLSSGVEIHDLPRFYEIITRKIPLDALEETWFLENIAERQKFYDPLKRAAEFIAAFLASIILLPLELLVALIIKITSPGPIIYKQTRIGQDGREFTLYKFRTMQMHDKHAWPDENDSRITKPGKFLRKTHIDEIPQLWNVIRGDVSIVGPRPDFVDFYKKLEVEIPYYSIRTIIKPGLTGWAQVQKPIIASVDDTRERLEYDLYYIKNRSIILDLAIILKTLKVLLTAKGL